MTLSVVQKRKWKIAFQITISSILIGLTYPLIADGINELLPFLNGFFISLIGGLLISLLELEIFNTLTKRFTFIQSLIIKTTTYFLIFLSIIPTVILFIESIYLDRGIIEHFNSQQFQNFLYYEDFDVILFYALIFIGLIIFTRQISKKLGQGVLFSYISGRYHRPKEVERIFMYLDLRGSTPIAEKLGGVDFHHFMHDFYGDITESILAVKGSIYDYIGDKLIVAWDMQKGIENCNCILAYFNVKHKIFKIREKYINKYGIVPRFSASFHCGEVIIGELGDIKSQIIYQGEVLYQTAAIEKLFGKYAPEEDILISEPLVQKLKLPKLYSAEFITKIDDLSEGTIPVYTLIENKAIA
ncbi:MAG: adenylate/guanylate cyclase domain-containing protein [Bacteroidota bacterium]